MKKLTLLIFISVLSFTIALAQNPDFNFEVWNNVPFGTIQDPQGWASLNALSTFGGAQSVFKEISSPFAGTASAKITTIKVTGTTIPNPYTSGNLDTAGLLVIGAISISPPGINYGYNYTTRSLILSFQSKYTPIQGDSAFVFAYLTKWNGTSRDTIASGKYETGENTSNYALNSLTMNYNPNFANIVPDSERVLISSSIYSHFGAKIGSAFYIDDMAWSGINSVNDINASYNNMAVFPNPASNFITFSSAAAECSTIQIFDITGRSLGAYAMHNNKTSIQTTEYSPGFYSFCGLNQKNIIISRGRFEIIK